MTHLLDTNVVSDLRRGPRTNRGVAAWFEARQADELCLSVVTLGEIRQGIERLRPRDAAQAEALDAWLLGLSQFYEERLLYVDGEVAEEWGRLHARRTLPVIDGLLAATARVHSLTLVTRNVRDFAGLQVRVVNPFT